MQFIDILRKDIKELDAKKIGITYEFDTPLDSSKGSSVYTPKIQLRHVRDVHLMPTSRVS